MKNDLISVVVPIYNVEKYIHRCVDSIINQTYRNLQIILVDDGTKDNCGIICDDYAKKDSRILVIHKKNGGLSDARNAGIDVAKGKYITFIDSDDYVELDYVQYLYQLIKKYNVNISFCKHRVIYEKKLKKSNEKVIKKDSKIYKLDAFEDILYAHNFEVSAWSKMYLTEQFKNIRYPKGKLFEDNDTTYKLIELNDNIAVGFEYKYNYIIRKNSITQRDFNVKQLYLIEAVDHMCDYLDSKYITLKKATNRKRFWARISTFNRMINSNNRDYEKERNLRKEILQYKNIFWDRKSSIRDKLSVIMLILGLNFYKFSWNVYEKITGRK